MTAGTKYEFSTADGKVTCLITDSSAVTRSFWNGDVGVVFIEATTTREELSKELVRGTLVQYENVAVPNPEYDPRVNSQTLEKMVEKRKIREKLDATLPEDVVSFMRYQLALKEGRNVGNRAYLDGLFK